MVCRQAAARCGAFLAAAGFFWASGSQRQRVYTPAHFVGKQAINHTLTLDPRLAGEGAGDDQQSEVRLTPLARAGVARVLVGFVHDFKPLGRKGGGEFRAYCLGNAHDGPKVGRGPFRVKPPAAAAPISLQIS